MIKGYLIGALVNPEIPRIAHDLRRQGFDIVDDWHAAGPQADVIWRDYEVARGRSFKQALRGKHAECAFEYDKRWLEQADFAVLALPAGKSAHLELGWFLGRDKPGWVLFDKEPERFDLMYRFATGVCFSEEELYRELRKFYGTL